MDNNIKDSYTQVKMPEDSKEQIRRKILESKVTMESGMKGAGREKGSDKKILVPRWKAGLAACLALALFIPAGVYAAEKISKYFNVNINKDTYQAEINLEKAEAGETVVKKGNSSEKSMKYIRVETSFGEDYEPSPDNEAVSYVQDEDGKTTAHKYKVQTGTDGMYSFCHKDGYEAGKNFYYDVIYMDQEDDSVLNLYDQTHMKEIVINGHKAFLSQSAGVQESQYRSEHAKDYTINLYVFYEEYGYIINYCGMQGLGQEKLVALAEKTKVIECSEDQACRYQYLSLYHTGSTETDTGNNTREEIAEPIKSMGQKFEDEAFAYQVTDMTVSSKVKDMDRSKLSDNMVPAESKLWDKQGNLISYTRETIKKGDGVSEPEMSVTGTEEVQLKMVYVTLKVKAKKDKELFGLPCMRFFEKEGEKYYDTDLYYQYNRPEKIEYARMDFSPCYFRETDGGKGFFLKRLKAGEEQTYHFAYMVDADMTDKILLGFEYYAGEMQYVELKPVAKD